ncbi:MAG: methyltransferase domain-containing protein [Gammaproteobacteria bacterium]|jgi:sarcosine/dimethylglycine N-methyltransferase|nr:methyltransferase domain-containing protein [Gammaproteobacteria bacterium]
MSAYSEVVETAREYYNSDDADNFYFHVWGGEDIHIGLYQSPEEPIADASRRTVERMAAEVGNLGADVNVLDVGAGYGGAARYLAATYGCHVTALNLSEKENVRDREMNREQGLDHLIDVVDASFEAIPAEDASYHVVWSQDAFLHSGQREQVVAEVARVLKPGGDFVFTDPMQADDCPDGVLQPVLDRIHLDSLGSIGFYRDAAARHGLDEVAVIELTDYLVTHYGRVRQELERRRPHLQGLVSDAYMDRMHTGLGHWVDAGSKGYLRWGILHFRKRA